MSSHDETRNLPAQRRPSDGPRPAGTSSGSGGRSAPGTEASDRLLARVQELRFLAEQELDATVIGPHGQNLTVTEAAERADVLDARIEMDQTRGNLRHRRVGRASRMLTIAAVGVVDFPIMLWLASSVFNVDWTRPVGLPLLMSVVISLLATGGAAAALHHLGHNQRQHKNERRQLTWSHLSLGSRCSLVTAGLLIGLMGVVMFVRVYTEGVLSGLSDLAVLLALLVAVVLVVSATLVFWTAFRDGSLEQDDLEHYSRRVRQHLEIRRRYEAAAYELTCDYEVLQRRARRTDPPSPS